MLFSYAAWRCRYDIMLRVTLSSLCKGLVSCTSPGEVEECEGLVRLNFAREPDMLQQPRLLYYLNHHGLMMKT